VFRHYDFYAQALAKIERGYDQDLSDAKVLVQSHRVDLIELARLAEEIQLELIRYPAIDPKDFARKVKSFIENLS
jgi:hypothetical protein